MVKLFVYKIDDIVKKIELEKLYSLLDEVKLQTIKQKKKQKLQSILAYLLIKHILIKFYNVSDIAFGYNDYQKPYLINKGLHFNITHSYDFIVCAVSSHEVGVDIEKIRKVNFEKIAKTFFTKDEYELINKRNDSKLFFLIWTMKESYLKLIGKGLNESLKSFEVDIENMEVNIKNKIAYFKVYEIDSQYKCSACSRKNLFCDEIIYINSNDVLDRWEK